jgi:integrase
MAVSKTHQDYWTKRIRKRSYRLSDGERQVVEEWQVYIQHMGRREWFALGSNNKIVASKRAAEIYQSLRLNGWENTITKYKGEMQSRKQDCTVGEFLRAVQEVSHASPRSLANYSRWLRAIIAHLKGFLDSKSKFDYRKGGIEEWRRKVDETPLSYLTPDRVRKWQKQFLARAGDDPLKLRKAEHSVNSAIRNARALFTDKVLSSLNGIEVPFPRPFDGVSLVKSGNMRYRSEVDIPTLVKAGEDQLSKQRPEEFKIFLLSLFAGLRRNEIDKLLWTSVDWKKGCIRVEPTSYFSPKTETSIGSVPVDEKVLAILKEYHENAKGEFVIESPIQPIMNARYAHYRAAKHFNRLNQWLRQHGVDTSAPTHTLRKEYGRLVTEQYGIFAASKALRHAGIQITAAHYADDKRRILVRMEDIHPQQADSASSS